MIALRVFFALAVARSATTAFASRLNRLFSCRAELPTADAARWILLF